MKILIITGGISSERRISLMSAKSVKKALLKLGYQVKVVDLKDGLDEVKKHPDKFHLIFPVMHGEGGEGGDLHKFLATLPIPFIGGDWKSFKQGWYKIPFKKWCQKNEILTPNWKVLRLHPKGVRLKEIMEFGLPCVLKTSNGGSSREVMIIKDKQDLNKYQTKKILSLNVPTFVEEYLEGIEVSVGVIDGEALSVVEIRPPEGEWFDYKNKYSGESKEVPNAPSLTQDERSKMQEIASNIHRKLNLGHYCRIDFIFHLGKAYVLEVNTIPGLTSGSLLPVSAKGVGISFPNLLQRLISLAINR